MKTRSLCLRVLSDVNVAVLQYRFILVLFLVVGGFFVHFLLKNLANCQFYIAILV